jgi:hypothetical protein
VSTVTGSSLAVVSRKRARRSVVDDERSQSHANRKEINMSKLKVLYSLAPLLIVAGALNGCATTSPNDQRITANVEESIDKHPDLGPPGAIQVQTQDQVVYLNGLVGDGLERETAESLASQTPGVTKVVDSVAVAH